MHVALNLKDMRVTHAHADRRVCQVMADIELPHVPVRITEVCYPEDLSGFTDYELQLLYRNTTGQQAPGYFRDHVMRGAAAAILALPEADVDYEEARAQYLTIAAGDRERYRYVRGSRRPMLVSELFDLPPLVAAVTDPAELLRRGQALDKEPAYVPPAPAPDVPGKATTRAAKPPSAPGEGSVTERIYKLCDELRAAMPAKSLEEIRKVAIPVLEERGVNGNSARKGSSMWIQARRGTA